MRYHEIASGIRLLVSSEEQDLLNRLEDERISRADLGEREQEIARLMVTRGLLNRHRDDEGHVFYSLNSSKDIWSDHDR